MLDAKSAPLIAFKYSVCSGVQTDGPAALDVGSGAVDSVVAASEPEQAVKVSASIEVATISFFTRLTYQPSLPVADSSNRESAEITASLSVVHQRLGKDLRSIPP